MKALKKKELREAGWAEGPQLDEMVEPVRELQGRGVCDRKYLLKLLVRDFGKPEPKVKMREKPAPLAEAILDERNEEMKNVANAR